MIPAKKIVAIIAVALPLFCLSQTTLTSLSPTKFFTQSDNRPITLTIYGKNIWPSSMNLLQTIERIKVYFKKGDKMQEITGRGGISADAKAVNFFSADWLNTPGNIEVYMTIDGVRTNSLWLPVEAVPAVVPIINSVSPSKLKTGEKGTFYYMVRIYGKNFGENTSTNATIGGSPASVGWMNLADGVMDVWIPKGYINTPGTYNVQVNTKFGSSNVSAITIESPVIMMAPIKAPTTVKKTETRPELNNVVVTPANNKALTSIYVDPGVSLQLIEGIKVKMNGNIAFGEDRAILEKFIRELDKVILVDNQLLVSDNNMNMLFEVSGSRIASSELEKAKKAIEDKLKAMNFANAVVAIK